MDINEEKYLVFLNGIRGFGPKTINKLLNKLNNLSELWSLNKKELKRLELSNKAANNFLQEKDNIENLNLENLFEERNIKFITILDSSYPQKLKNIYDPPPVLFFRGELNFSLPAVAVIGSRNSTLYGRKIAAQTASKLALKGINIISGMAKGIDSTAHKGALSVEAGITTAVLGNGFDYIYPSENKLLSERIEKMGLLLTEFNPQTPPTAGNFPRRNRIISGLADLVLVVEAGKKSGTLITVDYALEQGKDVMAVPVNIDRPTSVGCNKLIKKGAALYTGFQDILDYFKQFLEEESNRNDFQFSQVKMQKIYPKLDDKEKLLLKLFQHEVEIYYDDILKLSGIDADKLDKILVKFELMEIIMRLKGRKYQFKGLQNLIKPI